MYQVQKGQRDASAWKGTLSQNGYGIYTTRLGNILIRVDND